MSEILIKSEPAGRLLDILTEACSKPDTFTVRQVWADVFGLDNSDTISILRMLADLIYLVDETKSLIGRLPNINVGTYQRPFKKIEKMLSTINLEASWSGLKNQIDIEVLYGLEFCTDALSRTVNTNPMNQDDLEKVRNSVDEVTEMIIESDIEDSLKRLLLANLDSLRQSLISYKLNGLDGIQAELERNFGSILFNQELIKLESKNSDSKSAIKRYFALLDVVGKTVSTAKKVNQLTGGNLSKLIGMD